MRFFFYGTLMAGSSNPVTESIHAKLRALGPAVTTGRLFAICAEQSWYPALLTGRDGGAVHGMAYETLPSFAVADLARLDDYEEYYPERPEASEYLRQQITVVRNGREELAEAYVFRAVLPPEALPIPDGDFRAWLNRGPVPAHHP